MGAQRREKTFLLEDFGGFTEQIMCELTRKNDGVLSGRAREKRSTSRHRGMHECQEVLGEQQIILF